VERVVATRSRVRGAHGSTIDVGGVTRRGRIGVSGFARFVFARCPRHVRTAFARRPRARGGNQLRAGGD